MKKNNVSVFSCIDRSSDPVHTVDLIDWCLDGDKKELIERLRYTTDRNEQKRIKNQLLPVVSVSGTFSKRQKANIETYNQLIGLDFDHSANPSFTDIEAFKHLVFSHPAVLLAMSSCGGRGVFGLVRATTIENHYEHFNALYEDFLEMGLVLDKSTSDITRLRVKSYDPAPLLRLDAPVYTRTCSARSTVNNPQKEGNSPKPHLSARPNIKWTPPASSNSVEDLAASTLKSQTITQWSAGVIPTHFNGTQTALYLILAKVANSCFDITGYAPDWLTIAGIMARCFGEWGRELFHDVCRHYKKYTRSECDGKYDEFLSQKPCPYAVSSVREIAEYYGF